LKVKTTTLKELNDKEEMNTDFVKDLKTHEIEMKAKEDHESQKKVLHSKHPQESSEKVLPL